MKNSFNYINILFSLLVLLSCGENQNEKESHDSGDSEKQEESTPLIASLTQDQIKAVGITYAKLAYKQLTASIKANGVLRVPNNNKGNATSLYGGVIKTLSVQIGDYVKKGQTIAIIENPQFIQMQEDYLTINSKVVLAEQELQRQQQLSEGNAGALKNLQSATAELNTLRTRKALLQQQIQLMGINPTTVSNSNLHASLLVKSPLSGVVSNVFAKIGSYVDVSFPIVEIVDNKSLHLDLQVFESDLPKIKEGQIIHFTITNNPEKEYDATIFSIGSSFENESKSIAVHAEVTGTHNELIDGMNITGLVSLDNVVGPAVPNDAIVEADGKFYIFIQTYKEPEGHDEESHNHEDGNKHGHQDESHNHNADEEMEDLSKMKAVNFEKIEVIKGVSDLGFTAITVVSTIPDDAIIVTKGAFFINAKLSNTEGHSH